MSPIKKQKKPAGRPRSKFPSNQSPTLEIKHILASAIRNHQTGNLQQAEKTYKHILSIDPNHAETLHAQAIMACQRGQHAKAIPLFQKAIHENNNKAGYHYNLGNAFKDMGRLDDAVPCYRQALMLQPDSLEAWNNLGIVFHNQGNFEEALSSYKKALHLKPDYPATLYNLANTLQSQSRLQEALLYYQKALEVKKDFPEVYNQLGNIFCEQGNPEAAIGCFQYALQIDPTAAEYHSNLAMALTKQGNLDKAIACYQKAIALTPTSAAAFNNLGNILKDRGRLNEAEACLRQALDIMPDYAEAYNNLGNILLDQGRLTEAEANLRRALKFMPDCAEIHGNLGNTLKAQERLTEAKSSLNRALELKPDRAEFYSSMASTLIAQGLLVDAKNYLRQALELKPDLIEAHSALLFCLSHNGMLDTETLFAEHCQFGAQFETPFRTNYPQFTNTQKPERPLRIGFVSGDLRDHAVAYFIEPILVHLSNYPQLSLHAYSNHAIEDSISQRLREHFADWVSVVGLSDATLAEKIRTDCIDILIDLSGHTAKNRLLTFARKPAPVQASWIGYPGTTGLKAMDYFLADRFRLPAGKFDTQFTEKIVQLPVSAPFLPLKSAPLVNTLPAINNGYVTFGSFNRLNKISHAVITLWSQLLRVLPESRMVLGGMSQDEEFGTLVEWFAREGVARERLTFFPRTDMNGYLTLHHQVDICLSPFPYTGGTTLCHALWMGVPSLTLAGQTIPSRGGASILGHVGLESFIAQDEADFVRKGLHCASDISALARLRTELRERFAQSAMGQPALAAAGLEHALRSMWRRWCAGLPAESFEVDLNKIST